MADPTPSEPKPPDSTSSPQAGFSVFWQELRRRHVVRVAAVYLVVGWLVIQVANATFEDFGIPVWAYRFVVLMVALGFPISVVLAWAFELTPEGIKTTKTAKVQHPDSNEDESHVKKRHWFSLGMAAAVPTLIFGVLALFFFIRSGSLESELASTEQVELESDKSIAVLPLENMSPDPNNAFFADGVHEDVLTNLSKIEELLVIGRTSTLQYRDTTKTLQQIGSELGVRYLVEGSVRRASNQVLVTVQLIDSQTGGHLWAENYNKELDDIFVIQATIAKEIAGKLHSVLSPTEIAKIEYRPTENQEAYDYYVRARQMEGGGIHSPMAIVENLELAVLHDPNFAEGWAQLAGQSIFVWNNRGRDEPELHKRAYEALEKAKRLNPDIADIPYNISKFSLNEHHDIETSIDYMLQAIAIDPNVKLGYVLLANRYFRLGRLPEAQHHAEIAVRIDPLLLLPNRLLSDVYLKRKMWAKAHALLTKMKNHSTDQRYDLRYAWARYIQTGDLDEFANAIELLPDYRRSSKHPLRHALITRDYSNALLRSGDVEPETWLNFGEFRMGGLSWPLRLLRAFTFFQQNRKDDWLAEVKILRTEIEDSTNDNPMGWPGWWSILSICYALESNIDKIEVAMGEAREKSASPYYKYFHRAEVEMHIAIAYLVLGEHEKAIETLEAASKMDSPIFLNRELDLWFIFDRLKGDPRFDALLEG